MPSKDELVKHREAIENCILEIGFTWDTGYSYYKSKSSTPGYRICIRSDWRLEFKGPKGDWVSLCVFDADDLSVDEFRTLINDHLLLINDRWNNELRKLLKRLDQKKQNIADWHQTII